MNLLIEGGSAEARYNVKSMRRLGSKRERERERERWTDKRRVLGRVSLGESESSRKSERVLIREPLNQMIFLL